MCLEMVDQTGKYIIFNDWQILNSWLYKVIEIVIDVILDLIITLSFTLYSPGFSAKYNTYSFMEDTTKEVILFQLVQASEIVISYFMLT